MKIAERWFVMAGVGLLAGIALIGMIVAIYAAWLFHALPDASDLADYRPATATAGGPPRRCRNCSGRAGRSRFTPWRCII